LTFCLEQQQRKKITQLLEKSQEDLLELKKELELQKELISTSPGKKDAFEAVEATNGLKSRKHLHMSAPPVMNESLKDTSKDLDITNDSLEEVKSSHIRTDSNSTEEEVKVLLKKLLKKEREKAKQERDQERSKKKEDKYFPGNYRSFPNSPETPSVATSPLPGSPTDRSPTDLNCLDTLRLSNYKVRCFKYVHS
jgi:hypothetical protein